MRKPIKPKKPETTKINYYFKKECNELIMIKNHEISNWGNNIYLNAYDICFGNYNRTINTDIYNVIIVNNYISNMIKCISTLDNVISKKICSDISNLIYVHVEIQDADDDYLIKMKEYEKDMILFNKSKLENKIIILQQQYDELNNKRD